MPASRRAGWTAIAIACLAVGGATAPMPNDSGGTVHATERSTLRIQRVAG